MTSTAQGVTRVTMANIDAVLLDCLPGTPRQICDCALARVQHGPDRDDLARKLTPNIVVVVMRQLRKRGLVAEGRIHVPYQNAAMRERCPEGQPIRHYTRATA